MNINLPCNYIVFGMKNDSVASKKVLKDAPPELKDDINCALNSFCDITQKRGIKGSVRLKSLDNDVLTYTIKPVKTNEVKLLSVKRLSRQEGSQRIKYIKQAMLNNLDYLFK